MARCTRSSAKLPAMPQDEKKTPPAPKQTQYGNLEKWLDEQSLDISETKVSASRSRELRDAHLARSNQKTKSKLSQLTAFLSVDLDNMSSESDALENHVGADHIPRTCPPVPGIDLTRQYSEQQKFDLRAKFREEDGRHFLANRQPGEKYPGDNPLPEELNEEAIEEYLTSDRYAQQQKALAKQKKLQDAAEARRRKAEARAVIDAEQAAKRKASSEKAAATRAANKLKGAAAAAALEAGEKIDNTRRSARGRRSSRKASTEPLTGGYPHGDKSPVLGSRLPQQVGVQEGEGDGDALQQASITDSAEGAGPPKDINKRPASGKRKRQDSDEQEGRAVGKCKSPRLRVKKA